jgi:ABC-type branched-subunit amino acid transport system ATPase component
MTPWEKDPLLKVEHLIMRFGGLTAIDDVSFAVGRNDISALFGPNGAGKTTVFNCITGFYKPSEGMLTFTQPSGEVFYLERLDDHDINSRARVARTFQNIRLFGGMTVLENLMVAQHQVLNRASGLTIGAMIGLGGFRRAEREAVEFAFHGWSAWGCSRVRTWPRARFPTATKGGSRSRGRCAHGRFCSVSMSRRQVSTRGRPTALTSCSIRSAKKKASRSS